MNQFLLMKVSYSIKLKFFSLLIFVFFLLIDDETTFSTTTNNTENNNGKMNLFFTENYDHENVTMNSTINNEILSSNEIKRRKSVSARFRSVSKDTV